jgi:hypothetical protein
MSNKEEDDGDWQVLGRETLHIPPEGQAPPEPTPASPPPAPAPETATNLSSESSPTTESSGFSPPPVVPKLTIRVDDQEDDADADAR